MIAFFSAIAIQDATRSLKRRISYCKNRGQWISEAYLQLQRSNSKQLKQLAQQMSVPRYSRLRKLELQSALSDRLAQADYDTLSKII